MNNSKADCSQSKEKLQMNKDLLKIRLFYNFDCIYHLFLLSIQIQSVIKSLELEFRILFEALYTLQSLKSSK